MSCAVRCRWVWSTIRPVRWSSIRTSKSRKSLRLLFRTFARTGAVSPTVKHFRQQGLLFPTRLARGAGKAELSWGPLSLHRAARVLHNPWYAGAYAYGRGRWRKRPHGRIRHESLPPSEWHTLIKDAHPGYITWEEFERNQQRLQNNAKTLPWERSTSPPREGPALLQGRAVCGLCGSRMHVRYSTRAGSRPSRLPPCTRKSIGSGAATQRWARTFMRSLSSPW